MIGVQLTGELRPETSAKTILGTALHASTEMLCSASPAVVDQLMERLLASGDVVIDGLPEDVEPDELECDDLVDAELDFADDDEERNEPDPHPVFDDGQSPFRQGLYELRVTKGEDGRLTCEAADDGWGAARGVTAFGSAALRRLDGRRNCYRAVAKWIGERLARSEGSEPGRELLEGDEPVVQKAFLASRSKGELKGVDAASFSRYVEGATLSWEDVSVPLRALFR